MMFIFFKYIYVCIIINLNIFLMIRIMHVLCDGQNDVTKDNFTHTKLRWTIKVFYYYYRVYY